MIPAPQQRLLNYGAISEFAGGLVLLSTLGPVVDYYPWPARGLHAQAVIAYALSVASKSTDPSATSSDDYSSAGWSAMARGRLGDVDRTAVELGCARPHAVRQRAAESDD